MAVQQNKRSGNILIVFGYEHNIENDYYYKKIQVNDTEHVDVKFTIGPPPEDLNTCLYFLVEFKLFYKNKYAFDFNKNFKLEQRDLCMRNIDLDVLFAQIDEFCHRMSRHLNLEAFRIKVDREELELLVPQETKTRKTIKI